MPDRMTGTYKAGNFSSGHNKYQIISYLPSFEWSLQEINIGNVHAMITLVSAEQVYNGKVELFNETELFHSLICFLFCFTF